MYQERQMLGACNAVDRSRNLSKHNGLPGSLELGDLHEQVIHNTNSEAGTETFEDRKYSFHRTSVLRKIEIG